MNSYEVIKNYSLNRHSSNSFDIQTLTELVNDVPALDFVSKLFAAFEYYPWIFSLIGSILVGLSGVLPLLIIPIEEGENLKSGAGAKRLKILLSFAVGGLLGDVFLHLLPEAWENRVKSDEHSESHPSLFCGLWVLVGMLVFVIVEKLFSNQEEASGAKEDEDGEEQEDDDGDEDRMSKNNNNNINKTSKSNGVSTVVSNGVAGRIKPVPVRRVKDKVPNCIINNNTKYFHGEAEEDATAAAVAQQTTEPHYHISGYLNLMANSIDNFTHGLAIGGSFCISFKIGVLSTFAILVHEIPHEVGDFAILLKSGFSRWDAAKAQICTASAGILGSMLAVGFGSADSIESRTTWILPFTAGGFLHIALVTVLPELIKEKSGLESFKQLASLILGIVVMAMLILVIE